jgi:hypothetical protein
MRELAGALLAKRLPRYWLVAAMQNLTAWLGEASVWGLAVALRQQRLTDKGAIGPQGYANVLVGTIKWLMGAPI